eukprot:2802503-Prymnesium_polylepis.1
MCIRDSSSLTAHSLPGCAPVRPHPAMCPLCTLIWQVPRSLTPPLPSLICRPLSTHVTAMPSLTWPPCPPNTASVLPSLIWQAAFLP